MSPSSILEQDVVAKVQAKAIIELVCDPRLTGSYGTLFSFYDDNSKRPSSIWTKMVQYMHNIEALNDKRHVYSDKFKARILDALGKPGLAAKIIKVHYEMPKKTGHTAFIEETSKIKLVQKTLGPENFEKYTCIKPVGKGGPFSFIIRTKDPAQLQFRLRIGDKTYTTIQLYMILQEKGMCDLRTLMRKDPKTLSKDMLDMDKNLRYFFTYLHRNNVVHKDLKPANIVYFPNSDIKYKVIDYGLCCELSDEVSAWKAKGTPGYMSPIFLLCNGVSLERVHEHYMNKRIHKDFYILAVDRYKTKYGDIVNKKDINDADYITIMKKNDEFAYAIVLLELQYMSKQKLYLKNRLERLLDYNKMYFDVNTSEFGVFANVSS